MVEPTAVNSQITDDVAPAPGAETASVQPLGRIVWHDLMTTDIQRSRTYYADLLGWTYEEAEISGFGTYPMIQAAGRSWGGIVQLPADRQVPPHWVCHVVVADADAAAAKAVELGGRVVSPARDIADAGRFAVIASPAGAAISAWEPAGPEEDFDLPMLPGAFCWHQLLSAQPETEPAFFGQIFGWDVLHQDVGGMPYTLFKRKDTGKDAGGMLPKPPGSGGPSSWLPYVAVENADAAAARVRELGGQVWVEPTNILASRFLVTSDPAGAMIALLQPVA